MTETMYYTWLMPAFVALITGAWRGRRGLDTGGEVASALGYTLLVTATIVFAGQMLWLAAFVQVASSADGVAVWSLYVTVFTGMLWVPIMGIAMIIAALWRRRVDA